LIAWSYRAVDTAPVIRADGRILVFGGPYSNRQATAAVLAEARRLDIVSTHVICTGDLAAYCGDPVATINLVREAGIPVVMGNCDEQLGSSGTDCGCGFTPGSTCERLSAAWFAYADAWVAKDARRWLMQLPRRIDIEIGGQRLAVIHGGVNSINQFLFASSPALIKKREIDVAGCDGIVAGHCGLPFTQIIDGKLWHNAGVVGLPANDGTPRVWFSLLTPIEGGLEIEHRSLSYDHAGAAASMARAGLPPEYRLALSTGIWPSCDVLPYPQIRDRGVPLQPATCVWTPTELPHTRRRSRVVSVTSLWPTNDSGVKRLNPLKFKQPYLTADNEPRATVPLVALKTLWFNTGTLCNITCRNCYIESSPKNDRLVYLSVEDIRPYLDEIGQEGIGTKEIGFTGGEPFMNTAIIDLLEECLSRGFSVLVLTNAMAPMRRFRKQLIDLKDRHSEKLTIRVSLDHFTAERHEEERGLGTFAPTRDGLIWLAKNGFKIAVAGRSMWGEDQGSERAGYARLFAELGIPIDASSPTELVLFPEMDMSVDVPEITTACWGILGKSPIDVMCATSRMVVKRKGANRPVVLSCTLIPYDAAFELGATLRDANRQVPLNHPHCAKFCVLGGASCSPA
jgi:predicted phosphodiesterase